MGNLDFLEKKTKYAISWDGIVEGKETFTNKGFANDDPADTWCKISTVPFKEGAFCKTNYNIINYKGFSAENAGISASCYECTMKRYFSAKYQYILFQVDNSDDDSIRFTVVHTDADDVTISERSEFQYNSITFPTAGWWMGVTKNGTTELGAMNTIMTIDTNPRLSLSGKGFTSPQKLYRHVSRPFETGDNICVWINMSHLPKTEAEQKKGFNTFCKPGDFDSKADIKLDENLADIIYHAYDATLGAYVKETNENFYIVVPATVELFNVFSIDVTYESYGDAIGLQIKNINTNKVFYFNPNITQEEYDAWIAKYFSSEP